MFVMFWRMRSKTDLYSLYCFINQDFVFLNRRPGKVFQTLVLYKINAFGCCRFQSGLYLEKTKNGQIVGGHLNEYVYIAILSILPS